MSGQAGSAPPWESRGDQGSSWGTYQYQADPGPSNGQRQATTPGPGDHATRPHGLLSRLIRGPGSRAPLRREREGRMLGGVLAGVSVKTGIDLTTLRIGLVILTLISTGLGATAYVLAWLLLPVSGETQNIASRAMADRHGLGLVAGLATAIGLLMLSASALGVAWLNALAWPIIVTACGLVLIWRNADPDEQELLSRLLGPLSGPSAGRTRKRLGLRIVITAILLIAGLSLLLNGRERYALIPPLGGLILLLTAIAVAFGPWWLRLARDVIDERQGRIRAEERADMATRVHDSVLQTLALIQRRATDPQQVIQLARVQERELRSWLFDGQAPGTIQGEGVTLAAGVKRIQRDVEAQHGIAVDAVTVGDCELDDDLEALLAAAREATVNAAKWSGSDAVSVFAEVEPDAVSIFVRDRGRGFDPDAVSPDRKGLAESIRARMARRGGSATVRSSIGEGTEVALTMPKTAGDRVPRRS